MTATSKKDSDESVLLPKNVTLHGSPTLIATNVLLDVESIPTLPSWSVISPSAKSLRTRNPIRAIVDPIAASLNKEREDGKSPITLALGDPTAYGNLTPCPAAVHAIEDALKHSTVAAGYVNACGTIEARKAVAQLHGGVSHEQVILANGCSGALELALTALLDTHSVLLVPQPGFPLYQVIAESHGASVVHYKLNHDDWTVDLDHLQYLLATTKNVAGVVINNPSNPTGAVYEYEHLKDICSVCRDFQLPIIADEIYGDLVFGGRRFTPMATVAQDYQVPVITASGIGKQFLLPGWRVGWIVFCDNDFGSLQEVLAGAKRLAQVILGASHLAQKAVPALLAHESTAEWKDNLRNQLEQQAAALSTKLKRGTGLQVIDSSGAMYVIVKIDTKVLGLQNDVDFADKLLKEEAVFVLPGSCFGLENAFRVVFCASVDVLEEAAGRICSFCDRHAVP